MPRSSARNVLVGEVKKISTQGPLLEIKLDCGFPLTALITRASSQDLELKSGTPVSAAFKASAVHLISR
jgi:molybdopterin-binding protein